MPEPGAVDPAAGYWNQRIVPGLSYQRLKVFLSPLMGRAGVGVKLLGIASTYPPPTQGRGSY